MLMVYGLKNCDTCRIAIKRLKALDIKHIFHDLRKDGLDRATVVKWEKSVGWENLLNQRSTTWRNLSKPEKDNVDKTKAIDLMTQYPALIKRPVYDLNNNISVGLKEVY